MKKNRIHLHSLRAYIAGFLTCLVLLFSVLVAYNNYSAYRLLRERIFENSMETLSTYQQQLDDLLERTDTWLYTQLIQSSDFLDLNRAEEEDISFYATLYRVKKEFSEASLSYVPDGYFAWFEKSGTSLVYQANSLGSYDQMHRIMEDALEDYPQGDSNWILRETGVGYLFIRIIKSGSISVGAYVTPDTLLATFANVSDANRSIYLCSGDGVLLSSTDPQKSQSISGADDTSDGGNETSYPHGLQTLAGETFLAVSQPIENLDFALTMLIPASQLSVTSNALLGVILIVSIGFLLIWLALSFFLNRMVQRPLLSLTEASLLLKSGRLDTRIHEKNQLMEFQILTDSFNSMVSEIQNLKIDIYEKQLERQRLEMEYLKQQITPHFMINCLNSAYQLTEANHPELARQMLRALSDHLRYTLSSGQTVALSEELKLVQNYVSLSGIRYPNSIAYFQECPEEYLSCAAIPLLILNFVENTIKYEVSVGDLLEIHVEISPDSDRPDTHFHICIWDTGGGFDPDYITRLQLLDDYLAANDTHIGLRNVILRAKHAYQDPRFSFTNRPGAGAQIDIWLPVMHFPAAG